MRHEELIGRTIANRFRVKRVLGEGGMATVYVAEQDAEPREVALKVLRDELTKDRTFAKRFEREAKAAARVQHPNSVAIFDAGVEGSISYIAMELLRGDDLYALLERHGVLSPRDAATILAEVCEALTVAHGLGIVHRDLKPENIMILLAPESPEPGGPNSSPLPAGARVKVLDFGIAKLLDRQAEGGPRRDDRLDPPSAVTAVTRVGTLIGTPAYMSPEQCALLPVDTRSDIYTCGVLLFQLVTGRLPFDGPTPLHIATKHIHEDPPPLRSVVPEADPAFEALVLKALAKRPADRHQTARHLGASLRKLLPALPDAPYRSALQAARAAEEATTDSFPFGMRIGAALPEPIASAKTVVAEGLAGPPPSVLVHRSEPPRAPAPRASGGAPPAPARMPPMDSDGEHDEMTATLVRASIPDLGEDPLAQTRESPAGPAGRQSTMQSAGASVAVERGARIPVVEAAPVIPPARGSSPAAVPPARSSSPVAVPPARGSSPSAVPPLRPSSPAIPAVAAPIGDAMGGRPSRTDGIAGSVPGAMAPPAGLGAPPTFGLPPAHVARPAPPPAVNAAPVAANAVPAAAAHPVPAAAAHPVPAAAAHPVPAAANAAAANRTLWIGILIGTGLSALLFTLAYLLFLSR